MVSISMAQAVALHRCAQDREIHYHLVDHELFHDFCTLVGKLLRQASQTLGEDHDIDLLRALKYYRFKLSALPLPFDHPEVAPRLPVSDMRKWVARADTVYPTLAAPARDAVEAFERLRLLEENPLLDAIFSMEKAIGTSTILIRESRFLRAVRDELAQRGPDRTLRVVASADLAPTDICEQLIAVGSSRWFPNHIFSAPVAPKIVVVSYRWNRVRWKPTRAFLGSVSRVGELEEPDLDEPLDHDEELETESGWPTIDWAIVARHMSRPSPDDHDHDFQETVEARLFALAGGLAVSLEAEEGATALVIDPRDDRRGGVRRVETKDIEPGMFVLLRTEGGGDYVVPVANRILGTEASNCREAQALWKAKLREHVRREGALHVALRLLELGGERADEQNTRNWMSERNIGTQGRDDFAAIMRLIGLEAETDHYWYITRLIRAAHLSAGMTIRRRLIEQVKRLDFSDLSKKDRIDVSLPEAEGGCLTVFRVEAVAPTTAPAPLSQVDRPFSVEE